MNEVSPIVSFEESIPLKSKGVWLPTHPTLCERGDVEDEVGSSKATSVQCCSTSTSTTTCGYTKHKTITYHPSHRDERSYPNHLSNRVGIVTQPSSVSFTFSFTVHMVESTWPKRFQSPVRNETRHCPSITCHGCVSIDGSRCTTQRRSRATRRTGSVA